METQRGTDGKDLWMDSSDPAPGTGRDTLMAEPGGAAGSFFVRLFFLLFC